VVYGDSVPPLDESWESDGNGDDSFGMIDELVRRINAITVSCRLPLPDKPQHMVVAAGAGSFVFPVPVAYKKTKNSKRFWRPEQLEKQARARERREQGETKRLGKPRHDARGRGLWRYQQQEQLDRARELREQRRKAESESRSGGHGHDSAHGGKAKKEVIPVHALAQSSLQTRAQPQFGGPPKAARTPKVGSGVYLSTFQQH
jgi:hypothetical protein